MVLDLIFCSFYFQFWVPQWRAPQMDYAFRQFLSKQSIWSADHPSPLNFQRRKCQIVQLGVLLCYYIFFVAIWINFDEEYYSLLWSFIHQMSFLVRLIRGVGQQSKEITAMQQPLFAPDQSGHCSDQFLPHLFFSGVFQLFQKNCQKYDKNTKNCPNGADNLRLSSLTFVFYLCPILPFWWGNGRRRRRCFFIFIYYFLFWTPNFGLGAGDSDQFGSSPICCPGSQSQLQRDNVPSRPPVIVPPIGRQSATVIPKVHSNDYPTALL